MTDRLRAILDAYLGSGMPPNIALMRLCIEAASAEEVRASIEAASGFGAGSRSRVGEGQGEGGASSGEGGPSPQPSPTRERRPVADLAPDPAGGRLAALSRLLDQHHSAFATIRAVMAEAEHDRAASSAEEAIAHWSSVFDRLAKAQPEAGVALYALGSPELLEAATSEIVEALRRWALIGAGSVILEIGCGIGRFVRALAPEAAHVTGLDVSREMIAGARQRCAGLPNVRLDVSPGRDLTGLEDERFDLILAADVFPYLVQAGGELAARHIAEAARVLRPGGTLAIFNYSYRGDLSLDSGELAEAARCAGFASPEEPRPTFRYWDGAVFLLRKPA
jgi:SAM-dependent methyltransferase